MLRGAILFTRKRTPPLAPKLTDKYMYCHCRTLYIEKHGIVYMGLILTPLIEFHYPVSTERWTVFVNGHHCLSCPLYTVMCKGVCVTCRRVLDWMVGFIALIHSTRN
jgi:hypothetical protein